MIVQGSPAAGGMVTTADPPRLAPLWTSLALVVALAGPPLFVLIPDLLLGTSQPLRIQIALQLLYCGTAASVVWIVLRREHLPLASIGLHRPRWTTVMWACVLVLVTTFALPLVTTPLVKLLGPDGVQSGIDRLVPLPGWFRVVVGVTGGAVEEILYRGYAIERLSTITGRRWLGAMLAVIAFGAAHVPAWGFGFAFAADLPFGVVMALFYLWKRDLLANMLAHSGGLVVGLLTMVP